MTTLALLLVPLLAADPPQRVVVPDSIFLKLSLGPSADSLCAPDPEDDGVDRAARVNAIMPVAFSDAIAIYGHVERLTSAGLIVQGRDVQTAFTIYRGGLRESVKPGALVRVEGTGNADGTIAASEVELIVGRDPVQWSKLRPDLEKFETKYWKDAKHYRPPAVLEYIRGIVDRLTPSYIPDFERSFTVHVVEDPSLNAFALPDGTLVIHTGIIARMDNEAQLASILAHEMAHVTQRHTLRAMSKDTEHKVVGWTSLLASIALGVTGKGDAAQGVQLMTSAWFAGFSREHEDEADRIGLRYLYLAGYDVREAPKVWKTFQLLYGTESQLDNFFYGGHSTAGDREHNLAHEVWKSYEPAGLIGGRVAGATYRQMTAALVRDNALLDLGKDRLISAEWGLMRSLATDPLAPLSHVALGRFTIAKDGKGGYPRAVDSFRRAIELDSECPDAWRELGYVLRKLGNPEEARAAFARYLELAPAADDVDRVRAAM